MGIDTQIEAAVDALDDGGTVIYPTETCYGIGCDATAVDAVEEIYALKQRPRSKPLTCVVDSLEMAERYGELTERDRRLVRELMPGPVTLVVDRADALPEVVNPDLAFRIPDSEIAHRLTADLGAPVIATSANISGQPSSYAIEEIDERLRDGVDAVIDAGRLADRPSSTIVDLRDGTTIYREGPVSRNAIEEAIHG